jgi:hypothetical protein
MGTMYVGSARTENLAKLAKGRRERGAPSVLVHSHVDASSPDQQHGVDGFRAWWTDTTKGLTKCNCGWASTPHYRPTQTPRSDDAAGA